MSRISKEYLRAQVERLNTALGRPAEGWTKRTDGTLVASVGHLYMQSHGESPRYYELLQISNTAGGASVVSGRSYQIAGFDAFLRGIFATLYALPEDTRKTLTLGL